MRPSLLAVCWLPPHASSAAHGGHKQGDLAFRGLALVGLLKPARGFAAHDEVEGGGVVYVGSWRSDDHSALVGVALVAALKDDGHDRAAAVGVGGGHVVEGQALGDEKDGGYLGARAFEPAFGQALVRELVRGGLA
jgi:hypothetical protein